MAVRPTMPPRGAEQGMPTHLEPCNHLLAAHVPNKLPLQPPNVRAIDVERQTGLYQGMKPVSGSEAQAHPKNLALMLGESGKGALNLRVQVCERGTAKGWRRF